MATSGEKRWPPMGNFVATTGEKPMAIDRQRRSSGSRRSYGRPVRIRTEATQHHPGRPADPGATEAPPAPRSNAATRARARASHRQCL